MPSLSKYNRFERHIASSMIFCSLGGTVSETKSKTSSGLTSHSVRGTGFRLLPGSISDGICSAAGEGVSVGSGSGVGVDKGAAVAVAVAG